MPTSGSNTGCLADKREEDCLILKQAMENGGALLKLWNRFDSFGNEKQLVLVLGSQGALWADGRELSFIQAIC